MLPKIKCILCKWLSLDPKPILIFHNMKDSWSRNIILLPLYYYLEPAQYVLLPFISIVHISLVTFHTYPWYHIPLVSLVFPHIRNTAQNLKCSKSFNFEIKLLFQSLFFSCHGFRGRLFHSHRKTGILLLSVSSWGLWDCN